MTAGLVVTAGEPLMPGAGLTVLVVWVVVVAGLPLMAGLEVTEVVVTFTGGAPGVPGPGLGEPLAEESGEQPKAARATMPVAIKVPTR